MNEENLQEEFMPEEAVKKKKPCDPKLSIIMLQLTACLILAAAAVCIRFFGGSLYGQVREKYISMFEDTTTVEEVMNLVQGDSVQTGNENSWGGVDVSSAPVSSEPAESDVSSTSAPYSDTVSDTGNLSSDTVSQTDSTNSNPTQSQVPANAQVVSAGISLPTAFVKTSAKTKLAETYHTLCMPTAGFVSSEYGWRNNPVTGDYALHAGIDIAADTGTPVYAAMGGEVLEVSEEGDYGIHVVLRHAGGLKTLYAHLNATHCTEGQFLERGDLIGEVGSTGRSTGPHLHFEVHTIGGTVDPRYLLPTLGLS